MLALLFVLLLLLFVRSTLGGGTFMFALLFVLLLLLLSVRCIDLVTRLFACSVPSILPVSDCTLGTRCSRCTGTLLLF